MTRRGYWLSATALAGGLMALQPAQAQCVTSGTLTGTCDSYIDVTGDFAIASTGILNGRVSNSGTIASLINSGTINGVAPIPQGPPLPSFGITNVGHITLLSNAGTIIVSQAATAHAIYTEGSFDVLTNSGSISASASFATGLNIAISRVGTLTNDHGTITASGGTYAIGVWDDNSVFGKLINSGSIEAIASSGSATGVQVSHVHGMPADAGTVETLENSGTISATGHTASYGMANSGTISTLNNSGTITANGAGVLYGLNNGGTISVINNSGIISTGESSTSYGVYSSGVNWMVVAQGGLQSGVDRGRIGALNNSGRIVSKYGVYNTNISTIAAITNSGSIIGSSYAIYNEGTLGLVTNSGVIAGSIFSVNALSLAGGSGAVVGTFAGGTITAPSVTFTAGNILLRDNIVAGSGGGTVTNSGATLELDSARTISGNYTQSAGSLVIDVTNATSYGSLAVSGSAMMSNVAITMTGSSFAYGQAFTIIDATTASLYSNLTINAGQFVGIYSKVGEDLVVQLGFPFRRMGAATGGDAAVMGGVFETLQANNASFMPVIAACVDAPTGAQGRVLTQAAPAQVSGGAALLQRAMQMTDQVDEAVRGRASSDHSWSLWGQMLGGIATRGDDGAAKRYNTSSWGLAFGADTTVADDLLIGGAFSWGMGWNSGTGDLSSNLNRVSSYQVTGYASWAHGPWTMGGQAAVGFSDYDQHRTIDVMSQTAQAHYSGHHYELAADAGYATMLGWATLTATSSMKWLRLEADGYDETGAGLLNLSVGSVSEDQVESGLGFRLSWTKETFFGVLQPAFTAKWLHDFKSGAILTDAVMSGVNFTTTAPRTDPDGAWLGAELTLYRGGGLSAQLGYGGDFRHGYTAHSGRAGISLSF